MTTTTLTTGRRRLGQRLEILKAVMPNGAVGFSGVASGSVTLQPYSNPNWGANQFAGDIGYRNTTATAADAERYFGALTNTSGAIAIAPAYTDTTLGTEELEHWDNVGLRPGYHLLNALNYGLEDVDFQAWEPLSLAADAAMRETAVASWGTHINATEAKQTTASRVYPGFIKSLAITNTSINGYLPTANITVDPLEPLVVAALCRTQSGTGCQLVVRDVTNSVTDATAITHSSSTWKLMLHTYTVPAGCDNVNIRIGGQGASDVTDWQALWVIRPMASTPIILPASYADERFKVEAVTVSRFMQGTVNSYVYEGLSMDMAEIDQGDYSTNFMAPAANPMFLQFHNQKWLQSGMLPWIQMRLPYSERGTFAAETDTTTCPLHLLIAAACVRLLEPEPVRTRIAKGEQVYQESLKALAAANAVRANDGPARRQTKWAFPRALN